MKRSEDAFKKMGTKKVSTRNYDWLLKDMGNDDVLSQNQPRRQRNNRGDAEYPLVKLEISNITSILYRKIKLIDTAGRIDKFKNNTINLKPAK